MATFMDLNGSFRSLAYTIQNRWSIQFPEQVEAPYREQMSFIAQLGRDTQAWSRLPDGDSTYARIISLLDSAARLLAGADRTDTAAMLAALRQVRSALRALDQRLRA